MDEPKSPRSRVGHTGRHTGLVIPDSDLGHGEVGSPIPNSRYVRGYCIRCREPIRILPCNVGCSNVCETCSPPGREHGSFTRPIPIRAVEEPHWFEQHSD